MNTEWKEYFILVQMSSIHDKECMAIKTWLLDLITFAKKIIYYKKILFLIKTLRV